MIVLKRQRKVGKMRYAVIVCFAAVVLFVWEGNAEAGEQEASKLVCPETVYDFGSRLSTNTISHTFEIRNEGSASLEIKKIRKQCGGCTSVKLATNVVHAGKSTTLTLVCRLRGYRGKKSARVYLRTNDPDKPVCQFSLTGQVIRTPSLVQKKPQTPSDLITDTFRISPGILEFGVATNGHSVKRSLGVKVRNGKHGRILAVDSKSKHFEINLAKVEGQERYSVDVKLKPKAKIGSLDSRLRLVAKDYRIHYIYVPVSGRVISSTTQEKWVNKK